MTNRLIMIKTDGKLCSGMCKFLSKEPDHEKAKCKLFEKKLTRLPNEYIKLNLFYRCRLCSQATGDNNDNSRVQQAI